MYGIIATISALIRTFYMPNPFEVLGNVTIPFMETTIAIPPIMLNILTIPFLHVITYRVVGQYYTKHKNSAAFGSFLYLVFYSVHVGLLYLMGLFGFDLWTVSLILIMYIMAHIGFNALKNKLKYGV